MGHALLAEMPTEEDELTAFRMTRGKVDEAAVEVLHLNPRLLELGDDEADLVRDLLGSALGLLHVLRIETAAVPRHLAAHLREPLALDDELLARRHEPPYKRRDHGQGLVRFLLAEEAHTC